MNYEERRTDGPRLLIASGRSPNLKVSEITGEQAKTREIPHALRNKERKVIGENRRTNRERERE